MRGRPAPDGEGGDLLRRRRSAGTSQKEHFDGDSDRSKDEDRGESNKAERDAALRLKRAQQAAALLKQVSDPSRLRIILVLAEGERHVGALCGMLDHGLAATSHQLSLLRHAGLIASRRQGKNNFYGLTEQGEQLASIVRKMLA